MKKLAALTLLAVTLLCSVPPAFAAAADNAAPAAVVDLNRAPVDELAKLPHVGPKRAALIVARRQEKPFQSVDELTEIKGIGAKTLEKIRPQVKVSKSAK